MARLREKKVKLNILAMDGMARYTIGKINNKRKSAAKMRTRILRAGCNTMTLALA